MPQRPDFGHGFCSGSSPSQGRVLITGTPAAGAFDPARCGGALQKLSPCGSRLWAVFHAGNSSRCAAVLQVFCRNPARCERNSSPQAALCVSQPELGGNQIVRFVTNQAPAPQAQKNWGGAQEGERRGGARGVCSIDYRIARSSAATWVSRPPQRRLFHARPMRRRPRKKMGRGQHPHLSMRTRELRWTCELVGGLVS